MSLPAFSPALGRCCSLLALCLQKIRFASPAENILPLFSADKEVSEERRRSAALAKVPGESVVGNGGSQMGDLSSVPALVAALPPKLVRRITNLEFVDMSA